MSSAQSSEEENVAGLMKRLLSDDDSEVSDEELKLSARVSGDATKEAKAKKTTDGRNPAHKVKKGFNHFKTNEIKKFPEHYETLKEHQSPKFLVFACSDSRVSPVSILNFRPGEAFLARNIGALVPVFDKTKHCDAGAVIEYAVTNLKVEHILVIGHSKCGGIKALMEHSYDDTTPIKTDFIHEWVKIGLPAKSKVKAEFGDKPLEKQIKICETEAVNVSLVNLLTYPYVQAGVTEKSLILMGGYYDFVHGKFKLWELDSKVKHHMSE